MRVVTNAEAQGLVILLDDLQWADAASLLLLQHVVTHRRRARLMIGATIRSGGPTLATLEAALHDVARTSSTRRFDLAGFDRDDVAAQLAALGHEPTADEVEAVANHTGGNPLFVREMGRLVQPGEALTLDRVPDAVRMVLAQRIASVPPTSRRTIAIASALGTDVDVDLVRAIAGRSAEDVLDDLAEAERAGVLKARPRGTVPRFIHDLMREGLQDQLAASELAAIHLAISEELERRGGHEAAIAHHRLAALPVGDARAAIEATLAAARAAMGRLAFEDAAALFERGLASSAASTLSAGERCAVLIDQGTALHHAHDLEAAIDVCARAATLAQASADVTGLARAALALQDVSEPRWLEQIDPWLTEALDALPPDDSSLRAQLLATLSSSRVFRELPGGDEASEEAVAMATRVDDVAALLSAYRSRQLALSGPDDTEGRLELGRRMLDLGETRGVDEALVWGHLWRFDALLQLGRVTDAEREIGELEPIAARTGRPHIRWHLDRCRVAVMIGRGQFGPARRLASETGFIPALAVIAQLTGERLPDGARSCRDAARAHATHADRATRRHSLPGGDGPDGRRHRAVRRDAPAWSVTAAPPYPAVDLRLPDPDRGGRERPRRPSRGATSTPALTPSATSRAGRAPSSRAVRRSSRSARVPPTSAGSTTPSVTFVRDSPPTRPPVYRRLSQRRVAASAPSWSSSGRPTTTVKVGRCWTAASSSPAAWGCGRSQRWRSP